MPRLIVMSKRGATRQVMLSAARTTLGRDSANTVVIDSVRASRRHAVVVRDGTHVWVRDLNSSNGTFVNEERVNCCRLEHGDVLEVGDFRVRFLDRVATRDLATQTLELNLVSAYGGFASQRSQSRQSRGAPAR
ncbi:MAG: FHA domain-containing protein [Variovorax sp.]|nr:MAG: FHA domain-containing protein [Variovorax sp.]